MTCAIRSIDQNAMGVNPRSAHGIAKETERFGHPALLRLPAAPEEIANAEIAKREFTVQYASEMLNNSR